MLFRDSLKEKNCLGLFWTNIINLSSEMINKEQISQKLETLNIDDLAMSSSFQLRKDAKVSATDYVMGFMIMVSGGYNTLIDWG
jgi:hypothetical protein